MPDPLNYSSPTQEERIRRSLISRYAALFSALCSAGSVPLTFLAGQVLLSHDLSKAVGLALLLSPFFMAVLIAIWAWFVVVLLPSYRRIMEGTWIALALLFFGLAAFWLVLFFARVYA